MAIVKKTYRDQIVDYVYQLLLSGELGPGDQLKENLLAEQMGISRAPIREAMQELILNGLVDYRPQVGNFIPILTAKQIVDGYTTRGVLEGYAIMETRYQFSREEVEKLETLTLQMEKNAANREHKMVVDLGGEFHDLLISKSDNLQLLEYTNRL
ncbi:MAG: GntR family transcriptional regulator, partial [Deltaproteobacteria bacterium]|nr:GntR family transcriptional regulator [Deltaproteobacteria bacterium]